MIDELKKDLEKLSLPEKKEIHQRFFKTGKGEYGEGDIFLGLTMPQTREICKKYKNLNLKELQKLLDSKIHEHRMCSLLILNNKFKKTDNKEKEKIFNLYMKNYKNINNWDLVDLSAPKIPGEWLIDKNKKILYEFAKSNHLWKKRIAVLSTFAFIRKNQFKDAINIFEILLNDKHDLIHKAVGWMLREIGKRNQETEERFLKKYHKTMPRTMLRYSIERFEEKKRQFYLKK
jgi:3-methyladenine DNA glycosylase AlkD